MNPGRRMLLLLAALFFAPIAISFFMYFGHSGFQPSGRVNQGDLVIPTRPLPELALPLLDAGATDVQFLRHQWSFLYIGDGRCDAGCRKSLYDTRQVRTALDRDMPRVQRIFIATGDCCDLQFLRVEHPDLRVIRATAAAQPLLASLQSDTHGADPSGHVFIVDPLGNLVMSYPAGAPAKGMLEDMQRLLKLSHIG